MLLLVARFLLEPKRRSSSSKMPWKDCCATAVVQGVGLREVEEVVGARAAHLPRPWRSSIHRWAPGWRKEAMHLSGFGRGARGPCPCPGQLSQIHESRAVPGCCDAARVPAQGVAKVFCGHGSCHRACRRMKRMRSSTCAQRGCGRHATAPLRRGAIAARRAPGWRDAAPRQARAAHSGRSGGQGPSETGGVPREPEVERRAARAEAAAGPREASSGRLPRCTGPPRALEG